MELTCLQSKIDKLEEAIKSRRHVEKAIRTLMDAHRTGYLSTMNIDMRHFVAAAFVLATLSWWASYARAEEIGSVNTNFRLPKSDRVVVEAYDDPAVPGVTCYVSRARTGGFKGALGVAEDPTEASIACRQVGPIRFQGTVRQQEDVFTERMSLIFKTLHVVRIVDAKRNALVYLTYSDRVASGSAKNSVSAVPLPAGTPIPLK